jgi:transcriptional regulator with XRE-family HTH domain
MQLDSFRTSQGWSLTKLAEKVGASHATVVRRWCLPMGHKDRLVPSPAYMQKIVDVSDGSVMPNDFYLND